MTETAVEMRRLRVADLPEGDEKGENERGRKCPKK